MTMTASPNHYRAHVSSESSFLHSLASIQKGTSSRSRRASVDEGRRSESKAPRRASDSGASGHQRSSTPQGILRTHHEDPSAAVLTPSQNRVSFAHQLDGTLSRRVTNYDIHASPIESSAQRSLGSRAKSPSPQSAPRPSLQASLPSLPRRPSACSSNPHKDLAAIFTQGSGVHLPFHTTPAPKSRPVPRSFSMLDTEDLGTRSVAPVPPLPFSQRRSETTARTTNQAPQGTQVVCISRTDYRLGELARSSSHMVIDLNPTSASSKVSALKNYDFAFIKRTDGSWTYAILAYRSYENDDGNQDECMMFVMNEAGSTKMIKKCHWAEYVRRVARSEEDDV